MSRAALVSLPGWSLSFTGCYGNDWVDTRALDTIAAEGVVFDQHYAIGDAGRQFPLPATYPVPGSPGSALPIFRQRFRVTEIRDHDQDADLESQLDQTFHRLRRAVAESDLTIVELPSAAPPWSLRAESLAPFFDPDEEELEPCLAPPVQVPPEDAETFEAARLTYVAVIRCVDEFFERLAGLDGFDDIAWVVTAQSSTSLGERGWFGECIPFLREETVHLPLLVRLPGKEQGGRRVQALTQPIDLGPTLAELLDAPSTGLGGKSLVPLLRGQAESVRPYAIAISGTGDWMLRNDDWAFYVEAEPGLFRKPEDRWEFNDLSSLHLEWIEQLSRFAADVAGCLEAGNLDNLPPWPEPPE